ncbi:MAG: CIA30 family protein [Spirochaetota bacterium]
MHTHRVLSGIAVFLVLSAALFAQTPVTGDWYYYNDANDGGSSKIIIDGSPTTTFKMKTETINGTEKKVAVLGGKVTTDFQYGFIGMGIKLDSAALQTAKKAKGIRFKVIGKNEFRCKLETGNITDYDYYGKNFRASGSVQTVEVRYSGVKQEGWGTPKSFDPASIVQISFQTVGQPIPDVSLKLFDLEFIM